MLTILIALSLYFSDLPKDGYWIHTYRGTNLKVSFWSNANVQSNPNHGIKEMDIWLKVVAITPNADGTNDTSSVTSRKHIDCNAVKYDGEYAMPESGAYDIVVKSCNTFFAR